MMSLETAPSFRWSADAVRQLDEDVAWALTSNPTGPAEVAGILLGKSGPTLEITDCQPVLLMNPLDHAYGLAGPGKREFERAIATFRSAPQDGLAIIGFYRGHIGERFELAEEDLELLRTCFQDSGQVILLLKLTDTSSMAGLFRGENGERVSEFHSSEEISGMPRWIELWDHLSSDVRNPDGVEPEPAAVAADAALTNEALNEAPSTTDEEPFENSVPVKRPLNRRLAAIIAATVVIALALSYAVFHRSATLTPRADISGAAGLHAASTGSRDSELALRAEKDGDDLRLDWNRKAPVLVGATGGMLTIREGNERQRDVILDGDLLRSGGVVYRPTHAEVSFKLVIFGQGGATKGESAASFPPDFHSRE